MKIGKKTWYGVFIFGLAFAVFFLMASSNKPSSGFQIKAQNWWLNPDGQWVSFIYSVNAHSKVRYSATAGDLINLPGWAFDNPYVLKLVTDKPMTVTVTARTATETRTLVLPSPVEIFKDKLQMTAIAVGPHLVSLGISWLGDASAIKEYQIWRTEEGKLTRLVGVISSNKVTFQDNGVKPGSTYKYDLKATANNATVASVSLNATTPPAMKPKSIANLSGKGMFIYIDPDNERSPWYYKKLPPAHIVGDAKRMGLRYLQIRTLYGVYSHFNHPGLVTWLAELLDLSAQNNIAVISWSVPRRDFTVAVAEDIRIASLVTRAGNTFAGCAIDLEPGPDYMGNLAQAKEKMAHHVATFRKAVGNDYLLSSIVFTPWVTGYSNAVYPYQELAQNSDVMQPMEFWHHFFKAANHQYSMKEVTQAIVQSILLIKKYSGRDIPVNVIGQMVDIGNTGVPSYDEITTALQAAKSNGALGISLFTWSEVLIHEGGMLTPQAQALANFKW